MENKNRIIIGDSRKMIEVDSETIDLIVTSPPYWHIKDYGNKNQLGYGQSLHQYLKDLYRVCNECHRVLKPGRRFCLNIGDQFARSIIYGRYKIIPLHAEFISQCEDIGFDYMGSIIWQKKTTMNTTGGASVMGSYPYPPNGIVELDYEFILLFKKLGKDKKPSKKVKEKSAMTKDEWKKYFYGHWYFGGAKQGKHKAVFPEELPKRLIKMFTYKGDIVLDPFVGSGTTSKAAINLGRFSIGYEINDNFLYIIKEKLGLNNEILDFKNNIKITKRKKTIKVGKINYKPRIKNAKPKVDPKKLNFKNKRLYKIKSIIDANTLHLESGLKVKFLGVKIVKPKKTLDYLKEYILKKIFILNSIIVRILL